MNLSRFQIEQIPISTGEFFSVYKAFDKQEKKYVCLKIILPNIYQEQKESILGEVEVLKKLDHPNIVKFYGSFEEDGRYIIVMEFVDGGNLTNLKLPLPESTIVLFFVQIVSALSYAHSFQIIHRNLKPGKILLTKGQQIKICDFNSVIVGSTVIPGSTKIGTSAYTPPEVISFPEKDHSFPADVWSVGCVVYELMTGKTPFSDSDTQKSEESILNQNPNPFEGKYTNLLTALVINLLGKAPERRLSLNEIQKNLIILSFPNLNITYIQGSDKVDLYSARHRFYGFEHWIFVPPDFDFASFEIKTEKEETVFIILEKSVNEIFRVYPITNKIVKSALIFLPLKIVGEYTFRFYRNLQSVPIPNTVTQIGTSCFCSCFQLQSINLPNSLTSLGDSCFAHCYSLQSIKLPPNIQKIPLFCFWDCKGLNYFYIPKSVVSIRANALRGCVKLFENVEPRRLEIENGSKFSFDFVKENCQEDLSFKEIFP